MDNNRGQFQGITDDEYKEQMELANPQVFKIGDVITVRGSRLRTHKINGNKITFKLLKK